MWLLIDDTRDLGHMIARDADTGLFLLRNLSGKLEGLMLDHDLGSGMSGYQVLLIALEEHILPDRVQLVTMNPVGRKSMEQTLAANGYIKRGINWVKE